MISTSMAADPLQELVDAGVGAAEVEAVGLKDSAASCAMTESRRSPAWSSSSELGRRAGGEFLTSGA
eukprot:1997035-Pyramimonas_sp.AAC.2